MSISGRLTMESFLRSVESCWAEAAWVAVGPAVPGATVVGAEPGVGVAGVGGVKVPDAEGPIRWGSALRMPEGPGTAGSVWGGRRGDPMEEVETRADGGGLGPTVAAPGPTPGPGPASCFKEGCEADSARMFWFRPAACNEWVLLWAALR